MTGSAAKLCGARRTVAMTFLSKQGGWFGRGVIPQLEPAGGRRMTGSAVERSGTKWTVLFTLPFKQGGWFGRGVIPRSELMGRWADFQRGFKKVLFFCINFCIDFGVDLGSYFGQKFDDFQRLLAFIFWL